MITDYHWIDDNSELEQLVLSVNNTDALAFDSEFERVNTFYPKPALFQLKVNGEYYLIDMTKISNCESLKILLNNIILHSGSEDLEILYKLNRQMPKHIFDTQIAASLCGYGLHYSYQNIVNDFFGIELSKAHSRSDWMQRPLTADQIQYAIDDVVYLNELHQLLTEKLKEQGRMQWFDLLMKQRVNAIVESNHVNKTFVKTCQSKNFSIQQQKLLYSLLKWRENQAKKRDKPRTWILKNNEINAIVVTQPQNNKSLVSDIGLYPKFVEYNAKDIISQYDSSLTIDSLSLPKFAKLTLPQGLLFKQLKQELSTKCESLNIPAALVINVSDLKSLVASGKTLDDVDLWHLISN